MKRNLIFKTLFLFIATVALVSCENEPIDEALSNNNGVGTENQGSFQVDIDGETFVASQAVVKTENGVTLISGINNEGTSVIMTLHGGGVGNYTFGEGNANSAGYTQIGQTPYVIDVEAEDPGNVEISEYDIENGMASGTFHFVATHTIDDENGESVTETVNLTNGIFENILLETDTVVNNDFDFHVTLDDDEFNGEEIADASLNEDGLLISAIQGNKQIGFQIFNPEVGTFDLANDENGFVVYDANIDDDESTVYYSASGTLKITSIDMENGVVSGTFSGTLSDIFEEQPDIEMTDGVFTNINFSTETPNNIGNAVIDGNTFNANVFPVAYVNDQIQINLDNDLDKVIQLRLPENITTGSHAITNGQMVEDYSASYEEGDNSYTSVADSGEIIINSFENEIVSGTFHFDVVNSEGDTISIQEGEFTVDVSF